MRAGGAAAALLGIAAAAAAAVPAQAATVPMHLGTHLMAFEARACAQRAAALDAPGTTGGAAAYRADVAWRAVEDVARLLKRATGTTPPLVARDARGRCTGAVPRVTRRRVRTDGRRLVVRWQRAYCLARANENYEVDKAATDETRRVVRRLAADLPRAARPSLRC